MLNLAQATPFLSQLHNRLGGVVAWVAKPRSARRARQLQVSPGHIPDLFLRESITDLNVWVSVGSF